MNKNPDIPYNIISKSNFSTKRPYEMGRDVRPLICLFLQQHQVFLKISSPFCWPIILTLHDDTRHWTEQSLCFRCFDFPFM